MADWLESLDCPPVVVPSLPDDEKGTIDGLRRSVDELNGHAAELGERGIRLGYHNHAAEFAPLESTTAWDVLWACARRRTTERLGCLPDRPRFHFLRAPDQRHLDSLTGTARSAV